MRQIVFLLGCFLCGALTAAAQVDTETFYVRVFGGADTVPPTTPTLLSATPIATTQIDVSWSAATDNYLVSGYVVSRDGVPLATTTLLSYADTGLTASTTYSYSVQAFDSSYNYSSSSNSIATTTPAEPVVPPTPTSTPSGSTGSRGQGTIARVMVDELVINSGFSTTSISLLTAAPSRIEVRWGKTASYELGYVINEAYVRDHTILLSELEPHTEYQYELIGYTPHGTQVLLKTGSFQTEGIAQVISPPNVGRFVALPDGSDVVLTWELPTFDSFSYVRVVRSHLGFPDHPQAGAVVYQGTDVSKLDSGILDQYSPVYYTVFVYDRLGNVSSGAVALAYAQATEREPVRVDEPVSTVTPPTKQTTVTAPIVPVAEPITEVYPERVTVDMKLPEQSEIIVTQGAATFTLLDTNAMLYSEQSFVVSVPKTAVSGNLKSIIVSVSDPTDTRKTYAYLLRINHDGAAYEATVPALGVLGTSQLQVVIYDYEAFIVATYQMPVQLVAPKAKETSVVFPDVLFMVAPQVALGIAILFGLLLLFIFFRRRRTEDNRW